MVESQCKCKCLHMSAQAFQSYENDFIFRKFNFTNNNNFCQSRKANITIYYFCVFSLLILHLFSLLASTPWTILVWIKTMFLKVYYVGILTFPTRMLGIIKILVRLDHVASKFQQFDVQTFTVHSYCMSSMGPWGLWFTESFNNWCCWRFQYLEMPLL